jgi:predicted methyltransferase
MRKSVLAFAAVSILALAPAAAAPAPKVTVAAAMASPSRDPDNVKLDEGRKPAEVLAFLGLKPGMHVLDLFGGNRYWSEIIAPTLGPKGSYTVWEPTQFYSDKTKAAFAAYQAKNANVSIVSSPFEAPELKPNSADFVILNDNYHDTYWQNDKYKIPKMDPNAFLKVLYAAVKPGGTVGVIDHIANPNDDARATVEKLHRIDPNVVKADFERAGFKFVGSSDLLRNTSDDHTLLVFDPKVRGHTDKFIYKFRKPA